MSLLRIGTIGRRGERAAAGWLKRRGYRILQRNCRVGRYEADLVAVDPDGRTLVIVEVKTRRDRAGDAAAPEERIDRTKRFHMAAVAEHLRRRRRELADRPVRFDAVSVVIPDRGSPAIRHIPAAFDSPI
jgi:putative endonuclease